MERTWNFRILARKVEKSVEYAVYEVHYENDVPIACTENSVKVDAHDEGDGIEDPIESIQWQLKQITLATNKPVLDYDNFPKEYIKYTRRKKLQSITNNNNEKG